jgi:hypothetical protein
MSLHLIPDELAPDSIRLPNGVEVTLGFGGGDLLKQDAIKENEG